MYARYVRYASSVYASYVFARYAHVMRVTGGGVGVVGVGVAVVDAGDGGVFIGGDSCW